MTFIRQLSSSSPIRGAGYFFQPQRWGSLQRRRAFSSSEKSTLEWTSQLHPVTEDYERIKGIFQQKDAQQNSLRPRLEKEFRERAFELMTPSETVKEFSPEEKRALEAFVSFDEDFHDEAVRLINSKKPIEKLTPEEMSVLEFYVNFDLEFKQCVSKVMWNDLPHDSVDPVRYLYVNFDEAVKIEAHSLIDSYRYTVLNEEKARKLFLFVNYNKEFQDKNLPLIRRTKAIDQLSKEEKANFYVFVNFDKRFEDRAKDLITRLKDLSDDEKSLVSIYVNHNKKFRKEMAAKLSDAKFFHYGDEEKRMYWASFTFSESFGDKARVLMWGRRSFAELRPGEQFEVAWYINCIDRFKTSPSGATPLFSGGHFRSLWGSREELRYFQNYATCHLTFLSKARRLIFGDKPLSEFTSEERELVDFYVHYNHEFQKRVYGLLTKAIVQLSSSEKRFFRLYCHFNEPFRERMENLISSIKDLDDFSPEERQLAVLYVNLDEEFQVQVKELGASKKEATEFSLKEERVFKLYATYHESVNAKAWKLLEGTQKSGSAQHFNLTGDIPDFSRDHFKSLSGSKEQLRYFQDYARGNLEFLSKAHALVIGNTAPNVFSREERKIVEFYIHYNRDFQKSVHLLLTKPFQQLSTLEIRIFSLYLHFNEPFEKRMDDLLWSIKSLDDFTAEEKQLATLYVNCDNSFQKKVAKLIGSKKQYSEFFLEEERIAQLHANFCVSFQAEAQKLVGQHHKKGGFYNYDCKFRYPTYDSSSGAYATLRPKSRIKGNFTPEEEDVIKLYVNFHLGFRDELNKVLSWDRPWTDEADRVFFLAMWYDDDLRVLINSTIWDKSASEKIADGSALKDRWMVSSLHILDDARRKDEILSKIGELYYDLAKHYYDSPHRF